MMNYVTWLFVSVFRLNAGDTLEALEIMGKPLENKNPAGW
jgi:hypothetical protein